MSRPCVVSHLVHNPRESRGRRSERAGPRSSRGSEPNRVNKRMTPQTHSVEDRAGERSTTTEAGRSNRIGPVCESDVPVHDTLTYRRQNVSGTVRLLK